MTDWWTARHWNAEETDREERWTDKWMDRSELEIRKNRLIGDFLWRCKSFPPHPQHFGNPNKGTIFCCGVGVYFIWVFYLSCRKAAHNVNSSTWSKNLVTQLDEELTDNHNYTDVMFVDSTSLPVVATFCNKYVAVVSTRSKFLSNSPL